MQFLTFLGDGFDALGHPTGQAVLLAQALIQLIPYLFFSEGLTLLAIQLGMAAL